MKIGYLREFKRAIRDIVEGEEWYRFLSALAEYDRTLLSQCYTNQKTASEYRKQAKELAVDLQNAEENWTHDRIELENLKTQVLELRTQLDESCRLQRETTASASLPEVNHRSYRPIGINPSEPLKGTDLNEYNT